MKIDTRQSRILLYFRGSMKKLIFLIIAILAVHSVFAEENFYTTLNVAMNNYTLNITNEQGSRIFDCNQNSTTNYDFYIRRNATTHTQDIGDLTTKLSTLTTTCDTIAKQYGDASTYFKLYTACNTENEICKKDRTEKDSKINELNGVKTNYDGCTKNLNDAQSKIRDFNNDVVPVLQTNLTGCKSALQAESDNKILWGFFGMLAIGAAWAYQNRKQFPTTKRSRMSGMGSRQN